MFNKIKKFQTLILIMALAIIFILVYSPHFGYPLPFHIDEWHHISEALRLGNYGEYFESLRVMAERRFSGMEIGFHFVLFLISWVFNLVSIYQFLPAIWAVFSALALFYVVYKKSSHNFYLAILAVVFFGSIKSNINLTGLWFFTPLTFSIPIIFLYLYFFTEGVQTENKKFILISLFLMLILIPTHSISVLFALPILTLYLLFNFKYFLKNILFFLTFLLVPAVGILFYKYTLGIEWGNLISHFWQSVQFKYGWGVLELKNSPAEIYSWTGYFFAFLGILAIFFGKKAEEYFLFLIWLAVMILQIIIYYTTGISYFSPYQRNFYYLALSLPFLSAFGLYTSLVLIRKYLKQFLFSSSGGNKKRAVTINIKINNKYEKLTLNLASILIVLLVLVLILANYYSVPRQLTLNPVINQSGYEALTYLKNLPGGK